MISEKRLPELNGYHKLEGLLPVERAPELNQLVAPCINDHLPIHRWFRFKEAFSADLLKTLLFSLQPNASKSICLLDPFCGGGTALVSAQELSRLGNITAIGIERNPFIHFIASTKISWPLMNPDRIVALGELVLAKSLTNGRPIPGLSGLTTGRCMSRYTARRLLAIRDAIWMDGSSPDHNALMLGLGGVVEQLSRTRKDGRALRLVPKPRQNIGQVLSRKWAQIASDVRFMQLLAPKAPIPTVFLGDGRVPASLGIPPCSVDMLLTSPPYPNNIDYSEVYKLELWLLGFITDSVEFLKLRKATFRSHPTAAPADLTDEFRAELKRGMLKTILGPIIRRTRSSPERYRHRLIVGYSFDLWLALREYYRLLREKGVCVIVTGNSLHGGKHIPYLIPTDLLVSAIAERAGYRVEKIAVVRNFRRRLSGNHFLRESIVVLKKE